MAFGRLHPTSPMPGGRSFPYALPNSHAAFGSLSTCPFGVLLTTAACIRDTPRATRPRSWFPVGCTLALGSRINLTDPRDGHLTFGPGFQHQGLPLQGHHGSEWKLSSHCQAHRNLGHSLLSPRKDHSTSHWGAIGTGTGSAANAKPWEHFRIGGIIVMAGYLLRFFHVLVRLERTSHTSGDSTRPINNNKAYVEYFSGCLGLWVHGWLGSMAALWVGGFHMFFYFSSPQLGSLHPITDCPVILDWATNLRSTECCMKGGTCVVLLVSRCRRERSGAGSMLIRFTPSLTETPSMETKDALT